MQTPESRDYATLEISLRPSSGDSYAVEIRFQRSDSGAETQLVSGNEHIQISLDIESLLAYQDDFQEYGRRLSAMLFAHGRVRDAFVKARAQVEGSNITLRVALRLNPDDALQSLAWETLRDPERDTLLFSTERVLFTRYLDSPDMTPVVSRPRDTLRALVVVTNPVDLPDYRLAPIDVAQEVARCRKALGSIQITILARNEEQAEAPPTFANILRAVRHGPDILYLVCHGTSRQGAPILWLEQSDGKSDRIAGATFADRLAGLSQRPLLVVLASCDSAGGLSVQDTMVAIGPRLAQAGVGAVLAMRGTIAMETISESMPVFFNELFSDGQIDRALARARAAVLHRDDWWSLTLFMRLRDGRFWAQLHGTSVILLIDLERALNAVLPLEFHSAVPGIATILTEAINRRLTGNTIQDRLLHTPGALKVIQFLLEQRIEVEVKQLRLIFEPRKYLCNVTVRDAHLAEVNQIELDYLPCPYPGMVAFSMNDAHRFFGRRTEIDEALRLLRQQRRLFIIGPSGSGKSSLVFAGILPELQARRPGQYLIKTMRPGATPLLRLSEVLDSDTTDDLLEADRLAEYVATLLVKNPGAQQLILVVDQIEELFAQSPRSEREAFINALLLLGELRDCTQLLTLRADFYADIMVSDLWPIRSSERLEIAPLRGAALREAMILPAEHFGVSLDGALIERLLHDAADEPGVLPLLQETMAQLWDAMENRRISLAAYERLGGEGRSGLAVALATTADIAFDNLSPKEQILARRIFLRLIQFGEGRLDTRRQLPALALFSAADDTEQFESVLQHLTHSRLLTLSGEFYDGHRYVDIAHEALISGWPRLRQWISERRSSEQMRRRLEIKTREWQRLGKSNDGLFSVAELSEASDWLSSSDASELGIDPDLEHLVEVSRTSIETIEREQVAHAAAREANRRLALLSDVTSLAAFTGELETMLSRVATRVTADFAHWCAIDMIDGKNPILKRVAASHADETDAQRIFLLPLLIEQQPEEHVLLITRTTRQPVQASVLTQLTTEQIALIASKSYHPEMDNFASDSILLVPMVLGDQASGCVTFARAVHQEPFNSSDVALAEDLVSRVALAIENMWLLQQLQANQQALQVKVGELSTLLDAARILSSVLRPDEVLDNLMELVSRQLAVTTVTLWTIDTDSMLTPAAMAGMPADMAQVMRMPIGQGFTGQVAKSGIPLMVDDVETQAGSLYPDFQRHNRQVSYMGVPVVYRERIIGVLSVMTNERREFSDDEMVLLVGLADQAATALDNARLFQERERRISELTTINHISTAVNAILQIDELLSELHRGIADIIDVNTSLIAIYDDTFEQLRFPIAYDEGHLIHLDPTPLGDGINSWVVRHHKPLLIRSAEEFAAQDIDLHGERQGMPERPVQSCLAVPIMFSERVLGLINIQSYEAGAFDDNDLRFLTTVANQAAVAVNNAHLFSEVSQNAAEMKTLYDVTVEFSGTLDTDLTQRLVAQAAVKLINADICGVMLFDEQRRLTRQIFADHDGIRDDIQIPIRDDDLMAQTLQSDQPIAVSDLTKLSTNNPAMRKLGIQGVISMAIGSVDEGIGVIWVGSALPHDWSSQQRSLLSILANQALQALQSAELFLQVSNLATELEQRVADRTAALEVARSEILHEKERLEVVHAITLELTATLDLDKILSKALAMVSNHTGVARGSIMLKDTYNDAVVCRAVLEDVGQVREASFVIRFDTGGGLLKWVLQNQEAACIPDVRVDERWVLEAGRADDVLSAAAVPLMTTDNTLGALILSSPQIDYFSESQMRLLETIASEVAIAINNAQLYNYITDIASQLAETLDRQREETSRSRAILQSVTEGVIVLDLERRITLFNPAAEQVLEIPSGEVLEQPVELLQHFGDDDAQRQRAAMVYDGLSKGLEQVHDQGIYSLSLDLPEPTQIITVNMAPVVSQDGRRYGDIAVLRDITREIEADREKRQFISNISHELLTPLTAIKDYVDVLLIGSVQSLSEEQIGHLNIVKDNANQLKYLINDILDISRLDGGKITLSFSEVAINTIIEDVIQSLRLEAQNKDMTINVDIPDGLPMISADQRRLTQVVFSLFSNAIKYTLPGDRVTIRAHLNRGGMLQVDVEDTGVGMSTEQQKKLFRPFYRADNPLREVAGGTGLGLSIARSLVELHGGEMWVTSEIGKGSTFSFVIPPQQSST
jgi:GAF domain-containing protein/two-component sensor histidine kinase